MSVDIDKILKKAKELNAKKKNKPQCNSVITGLPAEDVYKRQTIDESINEFSPLSWKASFGLHGYSWQKLFSPS